MNKIVEQLPFTVTRNDVTCARFESITEALDYAKTYKEKYSSYEYKVYFEFYGSEGQLIVYPLAKQPGLKH